VSSLHRAKGAFSRRPAPQDPPGEIAVEPLVSLVCYQRACLNWDSLHSLLFSHSSPKRRLQATEPSGWKYWTWCMRSLHLGPSGLVGGGSSEQGVASREE
jgi:hypothetical protein